MENVLSPTSPKTPSRSRFTHTLLSTTPPLADVPQLSTPPSRKRPTPLSSLSSEIPSECVRSPVVKSPSRLVVSPADTILPPSPSKIGGLCVGKDGTEDIHPFAVFSGAISVNLKDQPASPSGSRPSEKMHLNKKIRSPVSSPSRPPFTSPLRSPPFVKDNEPPTNLMQSIMAFNTKEEEQFGIEEDYNPFLDDDSTQKGTVYDRDFEDTDAKWALPPISPPPKLPLKLSLTSSPQKEVFQSNIKNDLTESSDLTNLLREPKDTDTSHKTLESFSELAPFEDVNVPRFYFPKDGVISQSQLDACDELLRYTQDIYGDHPSFDEQEFLEITKACGLPRYMNITFFRVLTEIHNENDRITHEQFAEVWRALLPYHQEEYELAFELLRREGSSTLSLSDFLPILEDVLFNHPGLAFLSENTLFQDRYVETVISRIFYDNKCWNNQMTLAQFKRSGLLTMLRRLEVGIDLNQTQDVFSYKHFYVIYCKFWDLDTDHDLLIDFNDLTNYGGGELMDRILTRVMEGYGKPLSGGLSDSGEPRMNYTDFIWFILSEVDKMSQSAIEYWFRCLDLDGDCLLSTFELEYFYEEQALLMQANMLEVTSFVDVMCQMNDLVKPANIGQITLHDIKSSKMAPQFFDMFINLSKALSHENHQQVARLKIQLRELQQQYADQAATYALENQYELSESDLFNNIEFTPWCIFAESEYQYLVANANQMDVFENQELDPYEEEQDKHMVMTDSENNDELDQKSKALYNRLWRGRNPSEISDSLMESDDSELEDELSNMLKKKHGRTPEERPLDF